MLNKKTIKTLTGLLIILFLAFFIWRVIVLVTKKSNNNFSRSSERAVAVEAEDIEIGSIKEIKEFTGTIYPVYQYIIAPKISGRLEKLNHDIGDFVAENDVVALIDDAEFQQAVWEAKANLKIAQADSAEAASRFLLADQEFKRIKSLEAKGFLSTADIESAQADHISAASKLKLANAQIEQKTAALNLAEIKLSYTILKAGKSGFIAKRFCDEGSQLSVNSSIVSVIGIDRVIIRSSLIEKIYNRIKAGQIAAIETDAFPNQIFEGKVSRIAPILTENSRTAEMEIDVNNSSHLLKPGMFCQIKIVLQEKENTHIVPNIAIVTENSNTGIFVVDETGSTAKYIPVQLGITNETRSEILRPEISRQVITVGQYQLKDGSKILLSEE